MRPAIGEQAVKDSWFHGSDVLWTLGIPPSRRWLPRGSLLVLEKAP